MCANMTNTGKIGFIGPQPYLTQATPRDPDAMYIGASEERANISFYAVITNSFYDPNQETIAANLLLSKGVDCVHHIQSSNAINNVFSAAGKYSIGWGGIRGANDNFWLTSAYVVWSIFFETLIVEAVA